MLQLLHWDTVCAALHETWMPPPDGPRFTTGAEHCRQHHGDAEQRRSMCSVTLPPCPFAGSFMVALTSKHWEVVSRIEQIICPATSSRRKDGSDAACRGQSADDPFQT